MLAIFLSALILFFILSPGILGKFPPKGNKFIVAIVHALVFSILFSLVLAVLKGNKLIEGFVSPPSQEQMFELKPCNTSVVSNLLTATCPVNGSETFTRTTLNLAACDPPGYKLKLDKEQNTQKNGYIYCERPIKDYSDPNDSRLYGRLIASGIPRREAGVDDDTD
jgi:hypothetical protein